jgi:DNA-binding transcriptional MocR family regulator
MLFHLEKMNGVPLRSQIKTYLASLIEGGELKPGTRLPSTRKLARLLGVNRNTVLSAYGELEAEGRIDSRVGSGSFISKTRELSAHNVEPSVINPFNFFGCFAKGWADEGCSTLLQYAAEHLSPAGSIRFCIATPSTVNYPLRDLQNCAWHAIQTYGASLFDLGAVEGFQPFLEYLPIFLLRRGIRVNHDSILVTNGIQQAIDLIARVLLEPGDTVVVENTSFPGAISIFRSYSAHLIGIPTDREGMRVDVLEKILRQQRPKLIYTIPTFHNPTAAVMSLERRRTLLDLAVRYQTPIIEDDYVNEIRYDNRDIIPIKALDEVGIVIYVASLSKMLLHGIRLGWLVAAKPILNKLKAAKRVADIQSSYLMQATIYEFCRQGKFDHFLKHQIRSNKAKRDITGKAIEKYFPDEVISDEVPGGLFQYVQLPSGVAGSAVLSETRKKGVTFFPRKAFAVQDQIDNGIRLSFAGLEQEQIEQGIAIIGKSLHKFVACSPRVRQGISQG